MQTSTVHVLSTVWSSTELPEVIEITQYKYGGCCAGEETNLLREGGVYLLPLYFWDGGNTWQVAADLDVMFEVDNSGLIWSHSQYEGFNRFDGQEATVVADLITAMTSDVNFPAAVTLFGIIARHWGVMMEVTVLGATIDPNRWEWEQNLLIMSADNVLTIASNDFYEWRPESGDEFNAVSWCYLEQGGRYLILFDPSEGGPYIEERSVARINADGTITAISEENLFSAFNGFTVEQVKVEAERAIEWHMTHSDQR